MSTTVDLPLVPYPSLARYRKLVFQIAGLVAAVLGAFIDATTHGGIVTGVTWLLAVGAALQVALTYWPASWAVKFGASLLGVAFSGLAAGLTDGFSNAEVMLLAWQVTMWLAAGAVDNAPQPLPVVDPQLGMPLQRDAGHARGDVLVSVAAAFTAFSLLALLLTAAAARPSADSLRFVVCKPAAAARPWTRLTYDTCRARNWRPTGIQVRSHAWM